MTFRLLADATVVLHLLFVAFVVCGGLLVLRWRRVAWVHVPAAVWGASIEFAGWICPLTPLENWLRAQGGAATYTTSFVERYLLPVLYPTALSRDDSVGPRRAGDPGERDRLRCGRALAKGEGHRPMKRLCVFAGSSAGTRREYQAAAVDLGRVLATRGIGLVYGGARVGLMGAVADAVLAGGGEVIGVIPRALVEKEVAHSGLTDLRIVTSMHERKALMADLSDAFIALPGGWGTLDEMFEILTWAQLGLHRKPCGLLNVQGYFDGCCRFSIIPRRRGSSDVNIDRCSRSRSRRLHFSTCFRRTCLPWSRNGSM